MGTTRGGGEVDNLVADPHVVVYLNQDQHPASVEGEGRGFCSSHNAAVEDFSFFFFSDQRGRISLSLRRTVAENTKKEKREQDFWSIFLASRDLGFAELTRVALG